LYIVDQASPKSLGLFERMNIFPLKVLDTLNFQCFCVGHFPDTGRYGLKFRDTRHGTGLIRPQF